MNEENIYESILIRDDGKYIGFNPNKSKIGVNMKWIEWNKPLPDDIDSAGYKYENGELTK